MYCEKCKEFEEELGENCGAEGFPREGGWIKTLCDKCHQEKLNGKN